MTLRSLLVASLLLLVPAAASAHPHEGDRAEAKQARQAAKAERKAAKAERKAKKAARKADRRLRRFDRMIVRLDRDGDHIACEKA